LPHYHFHWDLATQRIRDDDGVELSDDAAALQCAEKHRELLIASFSVERHYKDLGVEVCDPDGQMLFRISLR
jgi:hypothetical protein